MAARGIHPARLDLTPEERATHALRIPASARASAKVQTGRRGELSHKP